MNSEYFKWRKMKSRDITYVEDLLFNAEDDYVGACGRFLERVESRDTVWLLCGKKDEISALVINSKSTVIPVFCRKFCNTHGNKEVPDIKKLAGLLKKKRIYSLQGIKNEVIILEDILRQIGAKVSDTIDYDLMTIDKQLVFKGSSPGNLTLCVPQMTDLDALAPLQAAYEQEEVLPKGSAFSPAASRVNIANLIAKGYVFAARLDGRFVGKINISAVSFTRYQVGGVYVHPDYRGMGIARAMAGEFIALLVGKGRGVTLFVKKNNAAACRLYAGLGFITRNDYRITYY